MTDPSTARYRIGLAGTNPADFVAPRGERLATTTEPPPAEDLPGESFENPSGLPLSGSQDFRVAQRQGDAMGQAAQRMAKAGTLPPVPPEDADLVRLASEEEAARIPDYWYPYATHRVLRDAYEAAAEVLNRDDPGTREPTAADMEAIYSGREIASETNEARARAFLPWNAEESHGRALIKLLEQAEARGAMSVIDAVWPAVRGDVADAQTIMARLRALVR